MRPLQLLTMLAMLFVGLFANISANAQSSQNPGFGVGSGFDIHHGLVVGVTVAVVAVAAVGITFLVLHNRGVVAGCIADSGGNRTLVASDKKVYSLLDTGPSLPVGGRVKLKGHKSGSASAPALQVKKVLRDYGRCQL